jgi:hypothetical protein
MAEGNHFDNRPAEQRMFQHLQRMLDVTAQTVLGEAQRDAPIEEGTLRGSGHVLDSVDSHVAGPSPSVPTPLERVIAFTVPYAAVQEVRDDYNHPHGGKAHYLGDAVKAHAKDLSEGARLVGGGL